MDVWPENWPVWSLFCSLSTQWRYSMAGPEGLDLMPFLHLMDRLHLSPEDHADMLADLRVIEAAALEAMHTKD